ncbi:hypothetical protein KC909_02860 [Candidatus Dojkabacteria bacterium]|uniref:Uncharacterized protein n=1 Tax=Candidatus Dojkabacteria bacterium TaxID=2099670 RepID=A0A955RJD9_9BACT|nr:hypothetical protein [Candidatus Dojkabacteria bacterium]
MLAQKQSTLVLVSESTSKKVIVIFSKAISLVLLSLGLTLLTYGTVLSLAT